MGGWATGIAVYILIWWISLFPILSIGAKRSADEYQSGALHGLLR